MADKCEHDFSSDWGEMQCVKCGRPNEAAGEYRNMQEHMAEPGQPLLCKAENFQQPDEHHLPVPVLVEKIMQRKSYAVAPHGHTTPFLTVEEWGAINDWVKRHAAAAATT